MSTRLPSSPAARVDPELERVRCLLAALRPDCADPLSPPPVETVTPSRVGRSDPSAAWGGVPRSMEHPAPSAPSTGLREVLACVDACEAPAPAVLRWLRHHGVLDDTATDGGLRGLYVDVALAFVGDPWRDLASRREGAWTVGRLLVLRSDTALTIALARGDLTATLALPTASQVRPPHDALAPRHRP